MTDIAVTKAVPLIESDEEIKDKLLFAVQIAVKQIQCCVSVNDQSPAPLTLDVREVHQLCESLDKTFFHGLKQCQKGYWPFVRYFTHKNTLQYLKSLKHAHTDTQFGRAWLCLALNENMLESYLRSFHSNLAVFRKHYNSVAMLQDTQRAELLLMLVAGLENVPINLDIENVQFGSGLSFFKTSFSCLLSRTPSRCSSDFSQYEYSQPVVSNCANDDTDSGVIELDGANDAAIVEDNCHTSGLNNDCTNDSLVLCNLSDQEIERITKYLNMALESEGASGTDLEVIRTKVVRRLKKSPSHRKNDKSNDQCEVIEMTPTGVPEVELHNPPTAQESLKENRLSKMTTDSGLSIEDRSNESSDNDLLDSGNQNINQTMTFDVINFQPQFDVTFSTESCSTPLTKFTCQNSEGMPSPIEMVGERGTPEGQEESTFSNIDRKPLCPGKDGLDDGADQNDEKQEDVEEEQEEEEAEISIYDLPKAGCKQEESNEISDTTDNENESISSDEDVTRTGDDDDEKVDDVDYENEEVPIQSKPKEEDPVALEIAMLINEFGQNEAHDIKVDEHTLLYLLVEVFEEDKEKFYKIFPGYLDFPKGKDQMALLVLTDRSLYTLKAGNNNQKFILCDSFLYKNFDFIMVSLNSQGFTIVSKSRKHVLSFFTADESLTGSILSNLEMAFRRFMPKQPLPFVVTDATCQLLKLRNFLSMELKQLKRDITVHHFALARWEDYITSDSPVTTPAGPKREGYLMYRHLISNRHEKNLMQWTPGYFILNGGILYCMEDNDELEPLFFVHIVTGCKGCRRVDLPKRPYAFEVILSSCDVLQLAAPDDYEASLWQEALLHSVTLGGRLVDSDNIGPTPCCIVICDEHVIVVKEVPGSVKTLGSADIIDLVAIHRDPSLLNCILMEFGIAEASKSCGDWVITFETDEECQKFVDIISWRVTCLLKVDMQVNPMKDLSLLKKLHLVSDGIHNAKAKLRELCHEETQSLV